MLNTLVTLCVESASQQVVDVNTEGRTEVTKRRAITDKEIVDYLRKR